MWISVYVSDILAVINLRGNGKQSCLSSKYVHNLYFTRPCLLAILFKICWKISIWILKLWCMLSRHASNEVCCLWKHLYNLCELINSKCKI